MIEIKLIGQIPDSGLSIECINDIVEMSRSSITLEKMKEIISTKDMEKELKLCGLFAHIGNNHISILSSILRKEILFIENKNS